MAISEKELSEILAGYPDEKPGVFNYMKAREDIMRLADEYTALLNSLRSLTPESVLSQFEQKKFLVLIDSSFVRDAQIFPGDYFINEGDDLDDYDSDWEDYTASIILGEYTACCSEQAIMLAADSENINPGKLIAYQIVG